MRRHRGYSYIRFAAFGTCLAISPACRRHSTGDVGATSAAAPNADSAKRAQIDRSRSSATQAVNFDEGERSRFTRVELMIQARFAGVEVTPKGSGFSIQIRGKGSFGSSNEPLVVIDGMSRSVADLGAVNPREVERIEVVKDAAGSFYGVRGANGVIVITTRSAR
jgi:TonB-dependent SusC/RagA subfamily outer membrane receptor